MSSMPAGLRPWPIGDRKPKNLGEFIARMRAEPGGFRSIDQEALRKKVEEEEAAAAAGGVVMAEAADEMDADSESDQEEEPSTTTIEAIRAARDEVLRNVDIAHQSAALTLDTISLLLTKEDPTNAGRTLSPTLRELVGIGTLGADKLAAPPLTEDQILDNKIIATGWKFLDINRSVDSLLSAASRLQKEISLETKYWADVLAVSESGWSVSRLPHEPQTVGVKFGFSEAAPEFKNNGLAPMRRGDDGSVSLDAAKVAIPQRVLVSITRGNTVVGRCAMPKPLTAAAPLESRVMEARNTIFHQELWHEMNREGRTLLSHGVVLGDLDIVYTLDKKQRHRVVFSLQALTDELAEAPSGPEDGFAETISGALHLLLSYAHRQSLRMRSQPGPPQVRQNRSGNPYSLLRPVIAYLAHEKSIEKAAGFMTSLTCILQSAGYRDARYTMTEPPITTTPPESQRHMTASEAVLAAFLGPREFQFELTITPTARMLITGRTQLFPFLATLYVVRLLPSFPGHQRQDEQPGGVLRTLFPPIELYPNLRELCIYIRGAVLRAITDRAEELAFALARQYDLDSGLRVDFVKSIAGTAVSAVEPDQREVRFEIRPEGGRDREDEHEEVDDSAFEDIPPELRVYVTWLLGADGDAEVIERRWTWTVAEALSGDPKENLDAVVEAVLRGTMAA